MSKPDDIQQDVWERALKLWRDDEADPGDVIIARAILAERHRHDAAYAALAMSNRCLRDVAEKVGPQHAFWDVIAQNDAILSAI